MDNPIQSIKEENHSILVFKDYKITKMNFYLNPDFEFKGPIDVSFDLDKKINRLDSKQATVTIDCKVFNDADVKNLPFTLEISIAGIFGVEADTSEDDLMKMCEINGTAVLFPFLRAAISTITIAANQPSLVLPLLNINTL
ncbi:MAG: protein-export chaperone SecB [Carboxydocellales bacterium]